MAPLESHWWLATVLVLTALISAEHTDEGDLNGNMHTFSYVDLWPRERSTAPDSTPGAACPTNECANGGRCHLLHGGPHCLCKPGFMGDVCQDLQLQLSCDSDRMTFQILKSSLRELNVDPSMVHMSNPACKLLDTSELHISATLTFENHTLCGTVVQVNDSHLIYTNEVSTTAESTEGPNSVISRSPGIQIGVSCIYLYDRVVSLPFPLVTAAALVTFMVKEGKFNVTMTLHPTAQYLEPHAKSPIIPLNRRLYVQLQIHGHSPQNYFTLQLEECWATPWAHHGSVIRHLVITDGVANDSTVDMIDSGNQTLSRFSLQMFRFIQYGEIYLHCRIWLCPYNSTHCQQQPRPARQRRELSDPYRKVVSCGPIKLAGNVRTSVAQPESGLSSLVLAGSFAAGIILLVLSAVGFAKALKKITGVRERATPAHAEQLL
ncbi:Zgc 66449 [Pristimantis euphronides]